MDYWRVPIIHKVNIKIPGKAAMGQFLFIPEQEIFPVPDNFVLVISILSAIAASIVAFYFFRFYRISGLSHLLGIPAGFTFLAASHVLFGMDVFVENTQIDNLLEWMSLIALSYSFSMMAMSYYYRSAEFNDRTRLVRTMSYALLPVLVLVAAIEMTGSQQMLISFRSIDEYFTAFNIVALGYILVQCINGILRGENAKVFYIPAGFALLWIGQLSILDWTLYENNTVIPISLITSLAGPILFIYALHKAVLKGGKIARTAKA